MMLGNGGTLVAWMGWRNINDNLNHAVHTWFKENPGHELVAMRTAGAATINDSHPRWLVSIARLAPDKSPIVWTSESRECESLMKWVNTVLSNTETSIIDIQIAGSSDGYIPSGESILECTWAMLIVARKITA